MRIRIAATIHSFLIGYEIWLDCHPYIARLWIGFVFLEIVWGRGSEYVVEHKK